MVMPDVCYKLCYLTWVPRGTELNTRKDFVTDSLKIIIWSLLQFVRRNDDFTCQSVMNATMNCTSLAHRPQPFPGFSLTTVCNHVPLDSSTAPGSWWRLRFHGSCTVKFRVKLCSWMSCAQEGITKLKDTCVTPLSFSLLWDLKS